MGNEWIIDVLADLKSFAHANGLVMLVDQLEQTANVATAEIATTSEGAVRVNYNDQKPSGQIFTRT